MKRFTIALCVLSLMALSEVYAQPSGRDTREVQSAIYRRSSIYTLMLDDAGLVKADTIKRSFEISPIPDKFNNHNLSIRSFVPSDYPIAPEERLSKSQNIGRTVGKSLINHVSGGLVDTTDAADIPLKIERFLSANKIANGMVAKWFNRDENGNFSMDLVAERGQYNASEMQAGIAKATVRGQSILADAGEELISNTFVVVSRFNYISKEEVMGAAKRGLSLIEKYGGQYAQIGAQIGSLVADVASKGYVIQTTSYLYKLSWNDSIAAVFYDEYWNDEESHVHERVAAFDNSDLFKFEYIGFDKAWADVQSTIFTSKTEDDLIRIATVKAIDAVIAKLQKQHDVFKTKTPLYTVDPLTAKIGLKEGLEKGDRFEVLEQTIDKDGRTKYVRKGIVRVDSPIWDNKYMAGEELEASGKSSSKAADVTTLKGPGKYYPGMLIRQIK
jgi:hypothetical protein